MSERSSVQNPLLQYAQEIGWEYVEPSKAVELRGGERGFYFTEILQTQLLKLNAGFLDPQLVSSILRELNLLKPNIEGNHEALLWMRGEKSIFIPSEKREKNVTLIDFEKLDRNVFQVTDEWTQKGEVFHNRADVVFLINGIPVAIAETKSASKPDGLAEGIKQIRRYHHETPEMMVATQVFEVTQLVDFFYGATWSTSRKDLYNWKDEQTGNFEKKVKTFFDRQRFMRVLSDYILFLKKEGEWTKAILRQHQARAVEQAISRVEEKKKHRGLVWHTQGSGKTYTMITVASNLLRESRGSEKPTVVMIVDRNELEANLSGNLESYGFGSVKVAGSKAELRDLLAKDYRGLIVSMIHKFDDIPANINTRSNITVLVDEAHRTTGGDLGNYLLAALPNATFIGFTGTPIDKTAHGKGTFKVFGVDDPKGYLDKYSIVESIEDGTTVKLHYALAPSDLRVDRNTLDKQFLSLASVEGISDIEELNAILDRAVELKEMMKSPTRMKKIAKAVAQHFQENVQPMGYKAFLVAVDREACALYKKLLDEVLPPEYSRVVISSAHNDEPLLKSVALSKDEEKKVRKAFIKRGENPQILIVTEKLLTGYDAPVLYCMYLDKPMRDHVLLQAIARVNRPYVEEGGLVKPCGLVYDFVGIFEKLEKALAFDSDVVASVVQNIEVLKGLFEKWMKETAPPYLSHAKGWDDKAKEAAIEAFKEKDRREEFFRFFRKLQNLYDILSPDIFLRPYMGDYHSLTELYYLLKNAYGAGPYVDHDLTQKTRLFLRESTDIEKLGIPGEVHELDAKALAALKNNGNTDTTKILNLRKVLAGIVGEKAKHQPFLVSIGERADLLAKMYEERQLTTQQALFEFMKLGEEYVDADAMRKKLYLDENEFAIYSVLRPVLPEKTDVEAKHLDTFFKKYPDFQWDDRQKSQLRAALYRVLKPLVGADKMIDVTNALMRLQRV